MAVIFTVCSISFEVYLLKTGTKNDTEAWKKYNITLFFINLTTNCKIKLKIPVY